MTGHGTRWQLVSSSIVFLVVLAISVIALGHAEAEVPPDNFEWTPPAFASDCEEDNYPDQMVTDGKTGDAYLINTLYKMGDDGYLTVDKNQVLRFNASTYSFEHHFYMPYNNARDVLAYDGHIYYSDYNYGTNGVSLGMDSASSTRSIGYTVDPHQLSWNDISMVSASDTEVVIVSQMAYRVGGSYTPPYDYMVDLITVDLSDFTSTSERILDSRQTLGQYTWVNTFGDELQILFMGQGSQPVRFYVFRYDMGTGRSIGPFNFFNQSQYTTYYGRPIFAPNGEVHIWWADLGPLLIKFDKDFGYVDEMSLDGLIPDPVTPSFGVLPLTVNETGDVFILYYTRMTNYMRALIISGDYSGHRCMDVTEGDFESWSLRSVLDGDDRVLIVWAEPYEDVARTAVVYQAPLSPDLEVDPASFRYTEDWEAERPITLQFNVTNVGRAASERCHVYVMWDGMIRGGPGQPSGVDIEVTIGPGASVTASYSLDLLRGSHHIRLAIRNVQPREFKAENNVFDAWIYVNFDKPPVLEVYWPHTGMFVDDQVIFEGFTEDREDPDTVTTQVHVPGMVVTTITGSGPWNMTVDTPDLHSGPYDLLIIASDGINEVRVTRSIYIDHPEESLWVKAFSPIEVSELLVGDGLVFTFEAEDLFRRTIAYIWTLNGVAVAEATTSFPYISQQAGTFVLQVEATNTHHTVFHEWKIPVRDPVPPALVLVSPEGDLVLKKGDIVAFEVDVTNPDDQAYSIVWMKDNAPIDMDSGLRHSMVFERSGEHAVRVLLTSVHGNDHVTWTVVVENQAPTLMGSAPERTTIEITESSTIAFSVTAEDPDGDPLTYTWSSSRLDLGSIDGRQYTLDLPCDDDEPYTIQLTVSDGEDGFTRDWTVLPYPPEPLVNHAPTLVSMTPPDGAITIHKDTDIDFAVLAEDIDGDTLSYIWGSSLLEMEHRNESGYHVSCPCNEEGQYTIYVMVSDGEESFRIEWDIDADPTENPPDMKNGGLPYGIVLAIILIVSALALAYAYWARRGRSEG